MLIRLLALAFPLLLATRSFADESAWPEFRGPSGDGIAADADLPIAIDQSVITWQTPIHGKGWSSPVVWKDQIWLTTATADGKRMSVVCIDRMSGRIVHDKVLIENKEPSSCHPMNSYASPTPVIEEGRVYVHFGAYLTACLDTASADLVWERRDFECDHYRGPASSPILYDGKIFIAFDGIDVQFVVALDAQTGETLWRKKRSIDYGTDIGDQMKAYGTAEVINVNGQDQLIYPSAVATIAYDPQTGNEIWTVYHGGMNASARPILVDGTLLLSNGLGAIVAVLAGGKGNITDSNIVWSSKKSVAKRSSPIVVGDLIFMVTDEGILTCRELDSGEIVWKHRLQGTFAASPIYASGRLYFFNMDGEILTLLPIRSYSPLAETTLGDGFMASPAVAGNQLFLRSKSMLYCIEK
ncbi:outer membrane biogenesis protein BamB [Novipirellula aureliae]|uniref:Outer membrane biogenesis protein BamB n=1 Tax=Novipirellula aureliae TaxID=2527966 RepID=A0A5C6E9P8_9BACT|nr:PQQ-like beta-propeller repeat protein [Novipirellula aureliae]TWU45245.1 outer membrane biogenesis protein BamB [Novipirellula aureliae]